MLSTSCGKQTCCILTIRLPHTRTDTRKVEHLLAITCWQTSHGFARCTALKVQAYWLAETNRYCTPSVWFVANRLQYPYLFDANTCVWIHRDNDDFRLTINFMSRNLYAALHSYLTATQEHAQNKTTWIRSSIISVHFNVTKLLMQNITKHGTAWYIRMARILFSSYCSCCFSASTHVQQKPASVRNKTLNCVTQRGLKPLPVDVNVTNLATESQAD